MKNKKGNTTIWIIGALIFATIIIAVVYMIASRPVQVTVNNPSTGANAPPSAPGSTGCNQNPSAALSFTDEITNQGITVSARNYKNTANNDLIGTSLASIGADTVVKPLVNASGYIAEIQPDHTVICGNQLITGKLNQFANVTIALKDDAGTGAIGGFLGSLGNDTAFTTFHNNEITLTGTTYRSTGRMFVVYEVSNTTSVQSVTLEPVDSAPAAVSKTLPNCYTNNLTGTPYRAAFEIPPIVNGKRVKYNLQTTAANGLSVSGQASLTIYHEQDGIDSLTGDYLNEGICDSNNRFFGVYGTFGANGAPASNTMTGGIINTFYFNE